MKSQPVFGRLGEMELVAQPAEIFFSEGNIMKKLFAFAITSALIALGTAFAQTDTHDVNIKIPNVLQLRITDGTGNNASANAAIEFDYQTNAANVDTYLTTVNGGGGDLAPTTVTGFGDVIVFANRGTWNVSVSSTAMNFNDNLGLGASVTGAGVALADIKVAPSGTAGTGVSAVSGNFDLTSGQIANGAKTQGWSSLGFDGNDYVFSVNGDEDPGEYTTVVTYSIAAP